VYDAGVSYRSSEGQVCFDGAPVNCGGLFCHRAVFLNVTLRNRSALFDFKSAQ